jgi:hypothetical protein
MWLYASSRKKEETNDLRGFVLFCVVSNFSTCGRIHFGRNDQKSKVCLKT